MKTIDIKLGYSCNNECLHCVIQDFRDLVLKKGLPEDIPTRTYLDELENVRKKGFDQIVVTGGEPTIRPDLPVMLQKARDLGFAIQMQTNGRNFTNLDFAREISRIAPISYCIALHGPNAAIHDHITQKSGSFEETVQGIKNLLELKQKVSGKIVISKLNAEHLEATARCLLDLGVSYLMLAFPHACGNARRYFFQVVPRYSEIRDQLFKTLKLARMRNRPITVEAVPFCLLGEYVHCGELYLLQEGESYLQQYGDQVKERNWKLQRIEGKRKFSVCPACRFDAICEGPWKEYPENYGEEEFLPVPGKAIGNLRDFSREFNAELILETLPDVLSWE